MFARILKTFKRYPIKDAIKFIAVLGIFCFLLASILDLVFAIFVGVIIIAAFLNGAVNPYKGSKTEDIANTRVYRYSRKAASDSSNPAYKHMGSNIFHK